MKEQY